MTSWRKHSERHSVGDRAGLVVILVLVGAVALLLGVNMARAQDAPARPEGLPELTLAPCPALSGIRPLEAGGEAGTWFPRAAGECMLGRLRLLPPLLRYVDLLEARISLSDERDALRDREVALAVEQAEEAEDQLFLAIRRAREAEESRDAWYRSPVLWASVGAVVVVVVEVVAIYAFSRLDGG